MPKEKVLSIRIKESQIENIKKKAGIKPDERGRLSKYIRKLIKSDIDPDKYEENKTDIGVNNEKYKDLENDYNELMTLHEDLSAKYHEILAKNKRLSTEKVELESTIEAMTLIKNDFLNQLLFLMKFFQKNASLLQQHDRNYILEHREKFAIIAKQLEGVSN